MSNVLFNGLSAVHAGSDGKLITSDTCLTPPYCVPIAYTNVAKSQDATLTATSVKINGNTVCNFKSNFAKSEGDSPGTCGGIVSGTILGMAEFVTFSHNILIEGVPVVRNNDMMVSNNKNTSPMPLQQPNGGMPPELSDEGPTELQASDIKQQLNVEIVGDAMHFLNTIVASTADE